MAFGLQIVRDAVFKALLRRDPYGKKPLSIGSARLMRVVIMKKGVEDARDDEYAIIFRADSGEQFAITASGLDVGLLVQSCCTAERP